MAKKKNKKVDTNPEDLLAEQFDKVENDLKTDIVSSETETKREKFKRLVKPRLEKVLKYLRLIGNLSNTSNYEYTEEDIDKIYGYIADATEEMKKKFSGKKKVVVQF